MIPTVPTTPTARLGRGRLLLGGSRADAVPIPAAPVLTAPSGVTELPVIATWAAVPNADTYIVQWNTSESESGATTVADITGISYELTGLAALIPAYVRIAALNSDGQQGDWSDWSSFTPLIFLIKATFSTDQTAPMPTSLAMLKGLLKKQTDSANRTSIGSGVLTMTTGSGDDPRYYFTDDAGDPLARVIGRTLHFTFSSHAVSNGGVGWGALVTSVHMGNGTEWYGWRIVGKSAVEDALSSYITSAGYLSNDTTYEVWIRLNNPGFDLFIKGGVYTSIERVYSSRTGTVTPLYPAISQQNNNPMTIDDLLVADMPAPFDAEFGLCAINQNPPTNDDDITAAADGQIDFTYTAANPLGTSEGHVYFRQQDSTNKWDMYIDSAGAFKVDVIVAGTPTNKVSVASVCAAGATVTMRAYLRANTLFFFTVTSAGAVTARGTVPITDTTFQTMTTIHTNVINSGAAGRLLFWKNTDSAYDALATNFAAAPSYTDDDVGEIQQLIDENSVITLDSGRTYTKTTLQKVTMRSNRTININGAILHEPDVSDADYANNGNPWFFFPVSTSNVTINMQGGKFTGTHVSGHTNAQMSAIDFGVGSPCTNIVIQGDDPGTGDAADDDIAFEDLVGFPIHYAASDGGTVTVQFCGFSNCGNGPNINADTTFNDNSLSYCEGLEASGILTAKRNVIDHYYTAAVSMGGDIGTTTHSGSAVDHNTITNGEVNKPAIVVADGQINWSVDHNTITSCYVGVEVVMTAGSLNQISTGLIQLNVMSDVTIPVYLAASAAIHAITVDQNTCGRQDSAGSAGMRIDLAAAEITITDNACATDFANGNDIYATGTAYTDPYDWAGGGNTYNSLGGHA